MAEGKGRISKGSALGSELVQWRQAIPAHAQQVFLAWHAGSLPEGSLRELTQADGVS